MGQEIKKRIDEVRANYTRTRRKMKADVEEKRYPLGAEPALIHPLNTSTVKVRDNGMIDIFVGTDNGLRIDPTERSITAMANRYDVRSTTESSRTERDRTANVGVNDTHDVGNRWTLNAGGDVNVTSGGTVRMEAKRSIHLKAPDIHLDAGNRVNLTPFPSHSHPEYKRKGDNS